MSVDILALTWGTSERSPGVVVAGDVEVATVDSTNQSLSDEQAAAVAQHVAALHNDHLAATAVERAVGPASVADQLIQRGQREVQRSETLIDLGHPDLAEMVAQAAKLLVEAGVQLRDRAGKGG
ncbi:hypothetical protein [Niveispirillum cyanobacteriorum]|uniref:Uncharacterized protein n=1 Tax=Niveispirillum cyanobacteriorum TaxID=1612173 RepID=A0A2K9NGA1_9PROT|nr:hypothetical protein [Niveispirillum cyanobacteriorum]AUN31265.1 hypothetical protein C0V82_14235 [Niveispirillum cyanobacteriorum]GGE72801.1 hypothetical protein GCM10011317_32560 [Niveispirillum cyanobacteriorum]